MLKSLVNAINGIKKKEEKNNKKQLIFFQSVVRCDDEMCDTGSSVNQSNLQTAHQVKRGEERE